MSVSKHKFNHARRDPERNDRLRELAASLFDQKEKRIRELIEEPIPQEEISRETRLSSKSGEAFMKAFSRSQYAEQAKTARLRAEFDFLERLLDLSGRDLKPEQDEVKSQEDTDRELLMQMLDAIKGNNKDPASIKEIIEETGGEFDIPNPLVNRQ